MIPPTPRTDSPAATGIASPARTSIFRTPVSPASAGPSPFALPAVKTVLLFAGGILLNRLYPVTKEVIFLVPVLAFLAAVLLYRIRPGFPVFWVLLISAGYVNLQLTRGPFPGNHVRWRAPAENIRMVLEILDLPEQRGNRIRVPAKLRAVMENGAAVSAAGKILLTIKGKAGLVRYGDMVSVRGSLSQPPRALNPGQFDYRKWLERQGIFRTVSVENSHDVRVLDRSGGNFLLKYAVYPLKQHIIILLQRHLSPDAAGLLQGMLLGMRGNIDREVMNAFSIAGVIHLLAVSGLHVGLVLAVFFFLFRLLRFPYRATIIGPMIMLLFYMVLTGMKPSVVRATIMALTILGGQLLERDGRIHNTIAVAALIILAVWPGSLFDIGFQLSFAATLGIIILYSRIMEWYPAALQKPDSKAVKYLVGAFTVSLAAQLGTAPFTAYYFNKISFVSLAVNLAVVPLAFIIICTGFVLLPVAAVIPVAAVVPAGVINVLIEILTRIVAFSAGLPGAAMTIGTPSVISVIFCLLLTVFLVYARASVRMRSALVICTLLWANTAVWSRVVKNTDRQLTATFLSVDDGAAALLELPGPARLLINSGGVSGKYNRAERLVRPFLNHRGIPSIDGFVATALDEDHLGGSPELFPDFGIDRTFDTGHRFKSREYLAYARQAGIERRTLCAGDGLGLGGAMVTCLHPDTAFIRRYGLIPYGNDHVSMVLQIEHNGARLLYYDRSTPLKDREVARLGTQLKSDVLYCHGSLPDRTVMELVNPTRVICGGDAGSIPVSPEQQFLNLSESGAVIVTLTSGGNGPVVRKFTDTM